MCQLCQHYKPGQRSVLQEVFHELELEDSQSPTTNSPKNNLPFYRLPWRERRAQRAGRPSSTTPENSLLGEVLQSI
ncbi:MAG: hypothetical protein ABIQ93_12320 [Saprospiraceae bacterium]